VAIDGLYFEVLNLRFSVRVIITIQEFKNQGGRGEYSFDTPELEKKVK